MTESNEVTTAKLADIIPDNENANLHSERGTYMVNRSIEKLGAGRSILLDKHNRIIAGNLTTEQAADIGLEDVIIVDSDGKKLVAVRRTDMDLDDPETGAREMAYADNRAAEVSIDFDPEQIAADIKAGIDLGDYWKDFELEELNIDLSDDEIPGEGGSDGSLLKLLDVTIDEPRHKVENGDVWRIGKHVLICNKVITEWNTWVGYLTEGALFAPYPGPFIPLSLKAEEFPIVMVQPDKYIAGHILDRYEDVNGAEDISRD